MNTEKSESASMNARFTLQQYNLLAEKHQHGTIMQKGTYMSFADIFVNPIASACCFPSAIIAWKNRFEQKR